MRAARLIVLVLAALAALVALAVLALVSLVDAGRFRPQIEAAVQSATGRPLRIDGDLDLDVFPFIGITVRDARLGNPPGYGEPDLLRWRELTLGARLGPLLRGRFELTRLRLVGADLLLERNAAGQGNWQGLGGSGDGGAADPARRGSLAGIELRDARLRYIDRASGARYELAGVDADIGAWSPGQPLTLRLEGQWVDASRPRWPLSVAATIDAGAGRVLVTDARVALTWRTRAEVAGLPLTLSAPRVEYDTAASQLGGAPLAITLGATAVTPPDQLSVRDWRLAFGEPGVQAAASLQFEARSLRSLLDASGIGAPYTTDPRVLGPLRLEGRLALAADSLAFEPLTVVLDATTLRGRVRRAAGGPLEIELAGDRMEIARYLEPADAPTPPFRFPTATLRALEARATVALERATLGDAQLEGVTLRLVLDEQGLRRGRSDATAAAPPSTTP